MSSEAEGDGRRVDESDGSDSNEKEKKTKKIKESKTSSSKKVEASTVKRKYVKRKRAQDSDDHDTRDVTSKTPKSSSFEAPRRASSSKSFALDDDQQESDTGILQTRPNISKSAAVPKRKRTVIDDEEVDDFGNKQTFTAKKRLDSERKVDRSMSNEDLDNNNDAESMSDLIRYSYDRLWSVHLMCFTVSSL